MKNLLKEARAVDVNCAIGRGVDRKLKFESADELVSYLRKYHIARGMVTSLMAANWNLRDGNEWLLKQADGREELSPCVVLSSHLGTSELPSADELRVWLKRHGVKSVRLYPAAGNYQLDGFYAGALLELMDELRMPLLIDWGEINTVTFPQACADFPHIPFVLLGAGFRVSRLMYPLLEKRHNVFFDICKFADYGLLEEIVMKFGAERLLFGSGMPMSNPGGAITRVCLAEIADKEKVAILGGNWRRIEKEVAL